RKKVRYCGRIVSAQGYKMDPKDIAAIQTLKEMIPLTVREVRKLVGFFSYYRGFIKDFSQLAKPLYDLLSNPKTPTPKNQPLEWKEIHQEALQRLIHALSNLPVMAYPDFQKPFTLHTDASNDGLGAVLYQPQEKKLRVIAYGSRTLTPAEKNYHLHSGKLEFLALKLAIAERFRDNLFYAPSFTVYSDNNPLTYVMTSAKLNATGHQWVSELSDFNFTIKYHPGKVNIDADFLSRESLNTE
uniref:Reverse transcriptase RNase H-like domain-containing protein n=1 Tax=Latimeria chalumnae TaxID=7897 RepID=H3AWX4_LATCH